MKSSILGLIVTLGLVAYASPAEARSRHHGTPPSPGAVLVENHAGVPVTVTVEGAGSKLLGPWESERFYTPDGHVDVRATYRQYGSTFTLTNRDVRVKSHRTTEVELVAPVLGKVQFVNDTGVEASVIANGREVAQLAPGATRLVSLPLGRNEVAMFANGVRVESECLDVRPFAEATVVARAPAYAELVVSNPLPLAVDVTVERVGERRISAYSSTVFTRVPVGRVEVASTRLGGFLIDQESVTVRAWSGGQMSVDAPRTGLVALDSDASELLRVFVDGRLVSLLEPYADTTLLLPTGPVVIEVRKLDGCLVERSYVTVDAFRTAELDFGVRLDSGQHRPHSEEERRDERGHDRDGDRGGDRDGDRDEERRHQPATW